jgi:hypothetical protein
MRKSKSACLGMASSPLTDQGTVCLTLSIPGDRQHSKAKRMALIHSKHHPLRLSPGSQEQPSHGITAFEWSLTCKWGTGHPAQLEKGLPYAALWPEKALEGPGLAQVKLAFLGGEGMRGGYWLVGKSSVTRWSIVWVFQTLRGVLRCGMSPSPQFGMTCCSL